MNKSAIVAMVVLLGGGVAGYWYWQQQASERVAVEEAPPAPVDDSPRYPLKPADIPEQSPLPALDDSDPFVAGALSALFGNDALMQLFINEKIIRNIVATIDNLTDKSLPLKILPIKTAEGRFITAGSGKNISISPDNAARYARYMRLMDTVDSEQLVLLYLRLYPLFQTAYEELGYPNKYFNDRLIFVIDDLLAAPDITEPVKLAQPLVVYEFADPELEKKSIGQRIMMRIGSAQEARLKAKLREIRQELLNHVSDLKQHGRAQ
jgi:hypothetical protein